MPDVEHMLRQMTKSYRDKISDDLALIVQIDIEPERPNWHVVVEPGRRVTMRRGSHSQAHFTLTMTSATMRRIYGGEMTALTAAARARLSDPAPLDFEMGQGVALTPDRYAELLAFIQRFFTVSDPERIPLGEPHARLVHGAHAIPLYYDPGFRSA